MRLFLSLLCLLTATSRAASLFADEPRRQSALKISKATTHLVEPLDADGYVDYLAAIEQQTSRGATAENNFEVVVRQVIGPHDIPQELRQEYYRRLGIPIAKGDFLVDYFTFHQALPNPGLVAQFDRALEKPWQSDDAPQVAAWLAAFDEHFDRLVQGSKRNKNYTPYLSGGADDERMFPQLLSVLLPSMQSYRKVARGLTLRANLRVGMGDLDGAWDDIQGIHRISRHAAGGLTLIESLVGIAVDSLAFGAAKAVLRAPQLTDDQGRRFLADLQAVPPIPPIANKIDVAERYMALDALQTITRQRDLLESLQIISELSRSEQPPPPRQAEHGTMLVWFQDEKQQTKKIDERINWNVTAVLLNKWYDRFAAAASEKHFGKRQKLFAEIDAEIAKLKQFRTEPQHFLAGQSADDRGRMIGEILVALFMPALNAATTAQLDAETRMNVLRLAFAAELYGRDYGRYPSDLTKLQPRYVRQIPSDCFSDDPLRFGSSDRNMLIYSVGRNGQDDRGRGYQDASDVDREASWDDIAIRIQLN